MWSSGNITKRVIRFSDMGLRYANTTDDIELPSFNMANLLISNRDVTAALNGTGLTERNPSTEESDFYVTEAVSVQHIPPSVTINFNFPIGLIK